MSAASGRSVDKHQVTLFYTAPTAIRALMREGEEPVKRTSRASSIRLLGTVGEPINPEAWEWYYRVVGDGRCPIVDTWWQTETGGILITPLPGAIPQKPGSATKPFFGVRPALVDGERRVLEGATEGNLVLLDSWPGQMRTVYGDHQRFIDTYFKTFPACTSPATARAATPTATTGSPAASTTSSTSPATASARPRSRARWSRIRRWPRPRWSAARTTSRARASTPTSP
jgi:acyl-CoA synthetase (AMP-forming)/AMP-acid ligase II